jgi:uncharacterized protein YpmS
MIQFSICPLTAEARVLDVTFPVNVILKFAPVVDDDGTVNVGVAENDVVTVLLKAVPIPDCQTHRYPLA